MNYLQVINYCSTFFQQTISTNTLRTTTLISRVEDCTISDGASFAVISNTVIDNFNTFFIKV